MDTSQICSAVISVNNTAFSSKIDPIYFSSNSLGFNNSLEISDKEIHWQTMAPNENHPFFILGSYLRTATDCMMKGIYSIKDYFSNSSLFNDITVDDMLTMSSPGYMKQYSDYNKTFKKQAQDKLKSLIINHCPDDEQSLQHIQILLKADIRTKNSLYFTTIKKRNIKLVALLNSYGVNIDYKDYSKILKSLPYCTQEDEIAYQCNDIHNFIKKISETTTSNEEYEKIEKQVEENYRNLFFELEEAIHLAKKNQKPLLILIGEDHESLSGSFVNQLMLLDMISQKKLVDTIQTEDPLSLFKLTYWGTHVWGFQSSIEEKIMQLGMKKKFIDLFRFNETEMAEYKAACTNFNLAACFELESKFKNDENTTIQNLNNRNQVMAQSILESPLSDSVAIVGAHHIKGLIEDTGLSDHYYIAAFNTAPFSGWEFPENERDYDVLDRAEFFLSTSEDVINVPEVTFMSEQSGVFIAPDTLIEKTKAIHYAFNNKKIDDEHQSQRKSKNLHQCPNISLKINSSQ